MKKSILLCGILACLSAMPTAYASDTVMISEQKLQELAQHRQWQHLIFVKRGKGEVISPNFYLTAPKGGRGLKIQAEKELQATLTAKSPEMICRYPARYLWLSQQLGWQIDFDHCANLPNKNQAISLILVGSYLKNPASTFGHILVKTDDGNTPKDTGNLLSNSYNYGATIPQNENGVLYALKGLFGVYQAGFAKAQFFTQDAVYAQNEQRDMWEYALSLDDDNKALLNYHLHEVQGAKFSYFFIKQNCGYRSGELLELISDIKMTNRLGGWYAPEFVFDQMNDFHQQSAIIDQITYHPSEQNLVRGYFEQLPKALQHKINEFIRTENEAIFDAMSEADQSLALDFLIAHRNYKASQKNSEHHQAVNKKLVAKRLALPAGNRLTDLQQPQKPRPTDSNRTTKVGVYATKDELGVMGAMFSKDPLDSQTELDRRFDAVRVELGIQDDRLRLKAFDFLHLEQIENLADRLAGEPKLSWRLQAGVQPDVFANKQSMTFATGGVGLGGYLHSNRKVLGYAFANAVLSDSERHLDGQVQIGVRAKHDNLAAQLAHQAWYRPTKGWQQNTQATLRYGLGMRHDVRLQADFDHQSRQSAMQVGWHYYW